MRQYDMPKYTKDGDRYTKHNTRIVTRSNLLNISTVLLRSKRCVTNALTKKGLVHATVNDDIIIQINNQLVADSKPAGT